MTDARAWLVQFHLRVRALEAKAAQRGGEEVSPPDAPEAAVETPRAIPVVDVLPGPSPSAVHHAMPSAESTPSSGYVNLEASATSSEWTTNDPIDDSHSSPNTPLSDFSASAREFFLGGNTIVRVGILVLTVGIALIAKYAADHSMFPLELRRILAEIIGIALLVVGYRTVKRRHGFGTTLQGGGIAREPIAEGRSCPFGLTWPAAAHLMT